MKLCGDKAEVNQSTVTDFKDKLLSVIAGYKSDDIFNSLPDRTPAAKGEDCSGTKTSKERITVMLCCSTTGEKVKPLVIGKARQPRCFKKVKTPATVTWASNKKAWMTPTGLTS